MRTTGKQYYEVGDIVSASIVLEAGKLHFFKNMVTLSFQLPAGDVVMWVSTPITTEDKNKVLSEIESALDKLIMLQGNER
jgi:hypothetical protein